MWTNTERGKRCRYSLQAGTLRMERVTATAVPENNCAKLAACLLIWMNLPKAALFTHTYWLNCRDGVIGSREELNTRPHPYKMCPSYILPHWDAFEERVWAYYDQMLATIAAA